MVAELSKHLNVAPWERHTERNGYANGYKDKQLKTRPGNIYICSEKSKT